MVLALAEGSPVISRRLAIGSAIPRMVEDVAGLEVLAIAGFLKDQIFREVLAIVTDVQASQKDVRRAAVIAVDPESTQAAQLLPGERIGGAGIAPVHVPGVLGEQRAHV